MALTGVHFSIRWTRGVPGSEPFVVLPLGSVIASETMPTAGTTTIAAPSGRTVGTINASAPIFYAIGPTPDATSGPRQFYDPNSPQREEDVLSGGDKLAWVFA